MSGKARPNLRKSIPMKLEYSNLSKTSKDCINEVFRRYERLIAAKESINQECIMSQLITDEYDDGYHDALCWAIDCLNEALSNGGE